MYSHLKFLTACHDSVLTAGNGELAAYVQYRTECKKTCNKFDDWPHYLALPFDVVKLICDDKSLRFFWSNIFLFGFYVVLYSLKLVIIIAV